MRRLISFGMPGPSSMMRTTTRSSSRPTRTVDVAARGDRVERVVDQVHPHLIELGADGVGARQVVREIDATSRTSRASFAAAS